LRRFVYQIKEGDIIYVKQGPKIVGKGVVTSAYQFDEEDRIVDHEGSPWQHQRRVSWTPGFPEVEIQLGNQQIITVVPLDEIDVEAIERVVAARVAGR